MEQIKSIFHKNRSFGDTSTKFRTNDFQYVLFKKSTLSSWKSKTAANFQDGPLVKYSSTRIFHLVIQTPNLAQMMFIIYYLRNVHYPAKNPRWPPVFKMAAVSNTESINIYISIFHFVIQTPNLAQLMFIIYFLRNMRYPAENPRWPSVFKMPPR